MKIILQNKIILKHTPDKIKDIIIKQLTMLNPAFTTAIEHGYSTWNITKFIRNFDILPNGDLRIPRGFRQHLYKLLQEYEIKYEVKDKRTLYEYDPRLGSVATKLKHYQHKYLTKLSLNNFEEGIIIAPAGSGKTIIGIALIAMYGQPSLWLTHRKRLSHQTTKKMLEFLTNIAEKDIGTIQQNKWELDKPIIVGSIPTMANSPLKVKSLKNAFGLIILDEAHHCPAITFNNIVKELNPYYLYGLTARAKRADNLEKLMFDSLGDIIIEIPLDEVAATGDVIMPIVKYKSLDTKTIDTGNAKKVLNYLAENETRNNIIVGDVLYEASKHKNICMVVTELKKHCEILYKLIKIGWDHTVIATGDYSDKHNNEVVNSLIEGKNNVIICTIQLLGEGVDINIINKIFIGLPFRSEQKTEQLLGRAQRPAKGKEDSIIYDYVDHKIAIPRNQFYDKNPNKECRFNVYKKLGLKIIPI